ncbi:MAG: CHAT domain-containing tetratricopeptide repeat protein [bacterium]
MTKTFVRLTLILILLLLSGSANSETWQEQYNRADSLADEYRYDSANAVFQRTLAMARDQFGPTDTVCAYILHRMGKCYFFQGDLAQAARMFKEAADIRQQVLGPYHPDYAASLINLAVTYMQRGNYEKAEPLYLQAMAIDDHSLEPDDPLRASTLSNLAIVYIKQEKYTHAEPLLEKAIAIREKAYGTDSHWLSTCLVNLAVVYRNQERYSEAEALYRRQIAIVEKSRGVDHPALPYSLRGLAKSFRLQGRYSEAEPLLERSLEINVKAFGPDHPELARDFEELSILYRLLGDHRRALSSSTRAFEIRHQNFRANAGLFSEDDAIKYARSLHYSANNMLTCFLSCDDTVRPTLDVATDVVVMTKGQVSDGIFARRLSLASRTDSAIAVLANSYSEARSRLSEICVSSSGQEDDTVYRAQLDSLSTLVEELESDLAYRSASFRRERGQQRVSITDIMSLLPSDVILIEYMRFDFYITDADQSDSRYLAVVLACDGIRQVTDLGSADIIDSAVARYQRDMRRESPQPTPGEQDTVLSNLFQRLWAPLAVSIDNPELILIAPDGALNLVSFGGLPDDSGRFLIEKYPLHYLSSGRDLIRLAADDSVGRGLLVLGDPDYDAPPGRRVPQQKQSSMTQDGSEQFTFITGPDQQRDTKSNAVRLHEITVDRLPGTAREVALVVRSWGKHSTETVRSCLGEEATEDNVKTLAVGKRVIHLATHGFYLSALGQLGKSGGDAESQKTYTAEQPLLSSGLLLAGCNLHGRGADSLDLDDGVLTAAEVCGLNLTGVQRVVLSACESALGKVETGEGVYGLRRAFQLAGARAVVSSLWPVSDQATADFMANLYQSVDRPLYQVLRECQLRQLRRLRENNYSDHPSHWAAFIAAGDWK